MLAYLCSLLACAQMLAYLSSLSACTEMLAYSCHTHSSLCILYRMYLHCQLCHSAGAEAGSNSLRTISSIRPYRVMSKRTLEVFLTVSLMLAGLFFLTGRPLLHIQIAPAFFLRSGTFRFHLQEAKSPRQKSNQTFRRASSTTQRT